MSSPALKYDEIYKWAFEARRNCGLDKYNIPKENIFSSRDSNFAKGIIMMTQGKGVDVIMNSLSESPASDMELYRPLWTIHEYE